MKKKWFTLAEIVGRKVEGLPLNEALLAFDAIRFGWRSQPYLKIEEVEKSLNDILIINNFFSKYPNGELELPFSSLHFNTPKNRQFCDDKRRMTVASYRFFFFQHRRCLDVTTMPEPVRDAFGWLPPVLLDRPDIDVPLRLETARDRSFLLVSERWFSAADLLALRLQSMPTSERTLRRWMATCAEESPERFRAPRHPHWMWTCHWSGLPAAARADFSTRRRNAECSTGRLDGATREVAMWRYMIRPPLDATQRDEARAAILAELQSRVDAGVKETPAAVRLAAEIAASGPEHPLWEAASTANAKRRGLSYRTLLNWRRTLEEPRFVRFGERD